jgi:dTMP kinase
MHVRDCIAPALSAGQIVICDRFTDSTRAYQGYAGGMTLDAIEDMKRITIGEFEPDLTFILDVPASLGLARSNRRMAHTGATEDRFENKELEFHEKLRQGYLDIASKNPTRCHVIDATQGVDDVFKAIMTVIPTKVGI